MRRSHSDILFYEVDILKHLFDADEGLSGYDLAKSLDEDSRRLATNGTIYRRLWVLEENGLIRHGEQVPNPRNMPAKTPYHITTLGVVGVAEFMDIDKPIDLVPSPES